MGSSDWETILENHSVRHLSVFAAEVFCGHTVSWTCQSPGKWLGNLRDKLVAQSRQSPLVQVATSRKIWTEIDCRDCQSWTEPGVTYWSDWPAARQCTNAGNCLKDLCRIWEEVFNVRPLPSKDWQDHFSITETDGRRIMSSRTVRCGTAASSQRKQHTARQQRPGPHTHCQFLKFPVGVHIWAFPSTLIQSWTGMKCYSYVTILRLSTLKTTRVTAALPAPAQYTAQTPRPCRECITLTVISHIVTTRINPEVVSLKLICRTMKYANMSWTEKWTPTPRRRKTTKVLLSINHAAQSSTSRRISDEAHGTCADRK